MKGVVRASQTWYKLEIGIVWWSDDWIFQGNGWNGLPVWIDGLDLDTVAGQKVGQGIVCLLVT